MKNLHGRCSKSVRAAVYKEFTIASRVCIVYVYTFLNVESTTSLWFHITGKQYTTKQSRRKVFVYRLLQARKPGKMEELLVVGFIFMCIIRGVASNCGAICRIWRELGTEFILSRLQSCKPRKIYPLLREMRNAVSITSKVKSSMNMMLISGEV